MFRWRSILVAAGSVALFAGLAIYAYISLRYEPGELVVLSDANCAAVTITSSSNLAAPVVFPEAMTIRLSPISHGEYTIAVQFRDGQTAWAKFFHYDVGRCPNVEMRITRHPNNRIEVNFCVIDRWGRRSQRFAATVDLSEMGAAKPLVLDWI